MTIIQHPLDSALAPRRHGRLWSRPPRRYGAWAFDLLQVAVMCDFRCSTRRLPRDEGVNPYDNSLLSPVAGAGGTSTCSCPILVSVLPPSRSRLLAHYVCPLGGGTFGAGAALTLLASALHRIISWPTFAAASLAVRRRCIAWPPVQAIITVGRRRCGHRAVAAAVVWRGSTALLRGVLLGIAACFTPPLVVRFGVFVVAVHCAWPPPRCGTLAAYRSSRRCASILPGIPGRR